MYILAQQTVLLKKNKEKEISIESHFLLEIFLAFIIFSLLSHFSGYLATLLDVPLSLCLVP